MTLEELIARVDASQAERDFVRSLRERDGGTTSTVLFRMAEAPLVLSAGTDVDLSTRSTTIAPTLAPVLKSAAAWWPWLLAAGLVAALAYYASRQ